MTPSRRRTHRALRSSAATDGGDLELALSGAARAGQFRLAYQPEFDLFSGDVTAIEALVRWQHPTLGELGPETFIGLAERSGLIHEIGAWVIDNALRVFATWGDDRSGRQVVLRINVSPLQLTGGRIVDQIRAALAEHGVAGACVCIELTEQEPLRDPRAVASTLRELKALGVSSAIDDLATGYSTLSNLRLLPFDIIKIDRSLVSGLDGDARAQAIVAAIVGLADRLGIGVVAEGVESAAELAMLRALGCPRAQGHFLAMPMGEAAARRLLAGQHHNFPVLDGAY